MRPQRRPARPIPPQDPRNTCPGRYLLVFVTLVALLLGPGLSAQPDGPAEKQRAEVSRRLSPPVRHLPDERRVIRSAQLDAITSDPAQRTATEAWLAERGAVALSTDQPGLTLHYYANGIEAMTLRDQLWEAMPRRADTMQALIDHAIARARAQRRTIAHLIITGHAGLPGCCAFGGTLDDCAFRGELTLYQRDQLQRLRPYLADDAEIELRQCTTAQGKPGQALLTAIHRATGAAASSYTGDFYFGDSASHPRVLVDADGPSVIEP